MSSNLNRSFVAGVFPAVVYLLHFLSWYLGSAEPGIMAALNSLEIASLGLCYSIPCNAQASYKICMQQMFHVCEKNDLSPDSVWNNYF